MTMTEINSWNDSAFLHTRAVWEFASRFTSDDYTTAIRELEDYLIATYFNGNVELDDPHVWLEMAAYAVNAHPSMDRDFVARTLCEKQRDYGPDNIARFAHKGVILRMHDKVARLENLLASGEKARNESIDDTYMDIVGYSVIGLMLLDGSFFLPLLDLD